MMTEENTSEQTLPNPVYVKRLYEHAQNAVTSLNEITRVLHSDDVRNTDTQIVQQIRRGIMEAHQQSLPLLIWAENNHKLKRLELPATEADEACLMLKNLNVKVRKIGKNYVEVYKGRLNNSFDFTYNLEDEFRAIFSCFDRSINMILRMKNGN